MPRLLSFPPSPATVKRISVFVGLLILASFAYVAWGHALRLETLAASEVELRQFQRRHPFALYGIAFLGYVTVTGLSLPGAAALSLLYGWFFGFTSGTVLVSFASTTGATVAFLLSRYLFRDAVQRRFGDRLSAFNAALERDGSFFLFTLRLVPVIPFFVINAVMGLTPIATRTFWWVSQLGMLPGTFVYLYAGSRVPSLQILADKGLRAVFSTRQLVELAVAFGLLGIFPLAVRTGLRMLNRDPNRSESRSS